MQCRRNHQKNSTRPIFDVCQKIRCLMTFRFRYSWRMLGFWHCSLLWFVPVGDWTCAQQCDEQIYSDFSFAFERPKPLGVGWRQNQKKNETTFTLADWQPWCGKRNGAKHGRLQPQMFTEVLPVNRCGKSFVRPIHLLVRMLTIRMPLHTIRSRVPSKKNWREFVTCSPGMFENFQCPSAALCMSSNNNTIPRPITNNFSKTSLTCNLFSASRPFPFRVCILAEGFWQKSVQQYAWNFGKNEYQPQHDAYPKKDSEASYVPSSTWWTHVWNLWGAMVLSIHNFCHCKVSHVDRCSKIPMVFVRAERNWMTFFHLLYSSDDMFWITGNEGDGFWSWHRTNRDVTYVTVWTSNIEVAYISTPGKLVVVLNCENTACLRMD